MAKKSQKRKSTWSGAAPSTTSRPPASRPSAAAPPAGPAPGRSGAATSEAARAQWWPAGALGVAFFALYAATTATGPVTGDNPEFVTAAHVLGVQHAPGYPIAAVVGHLVGLLPGGTAYTINLAAALCGAVSVALVFLTARRLGAHRWPAALGAAFYGTNALVWEFFIQIEAFPFLCLAVALTSWLLVRWKQQPQRLGLLLGAALTFGLGMATHQNMSLLVPAIVVLAWGERRTILRAKWFAPAAVGLALFAWVGCYTYVFWASARHPVTNWGSVSSVGELLDQLRRANYSDVRFGFGRLGTAPQRLWWALTSFGVIGIPLTALGLWRAWRTRPWYAVYVLIGLGLFGLVMILLSGDIAGYGYFVLSRFFLMWHVVAAPALALGLQELQQRIAPAAASRPRTLLVPLVATALVIGMAGWTGPHVNQRGRELTGNYARDLLSTLPPNAVFLVAGDESVLPVLQVQNVDGVRPDVTVVITPLLAAPWYIKELRTRYPHLRLTKAVYGVAGQGTVADLFTDNPDTPFYALGGFSINGAKDTSMDGKFYGAPVGLIDKIVPYSVDMQLDAVSAELTTRYATYHVPRTAEARGPRTSFEQGVLDRYAGPLAFVASQYADGGAPDQARVWFEKALAVQPAYKPALEGIAKLK